MINDLYYNIPTDVIHFADDTTTVTRRSERIQSLVDSQNYQTFVENWLVANGLELNKNKTSTMLFSLRELTEDDKELSSKFLGVVLDPTLNWKIHIENLEKQLSSCIFALRRLTKELHPDGARQAYFGLFHSKMTYGLLVWGKAPKSTDIFKIQKKLCAH